MAVIPLQTSTRSIGTGGTPSYPQGGGPIGAALSRAGGALQDIAGRVKRQQEELADEAKRQNDLVDDAKAAAFVAQRGRELQRQFEADPDYETIPQRAAEASQEIITAATEIYRDPQRRQIAQFDVQRQVGAFVEPILGQADTKRRVDSIVQLDNSLETFQQIYADPLANDAERREARATIEAGIQQGVATGLYDAEGADKRREVYIQGGDFVYGQRLIEANPNALPTVGATRAEAGSVVDRIIGVESGGNPTAKNPNSSATGLGQFTSSTWMAIVRKYEPQLGEGRSRAEVLALRNNGDISHRMTAHLVTENSQALTAAGVPVTDGTIYLAHFAGSAGAVKLLKADPSASAESVLGSAVVNANPFLKGKTAADVVAWANKKMGAAPSSSSGTVSLDDAPDWFRSLSPSQQLQIERQAEVRRRQIGVELQSSIEDVVVDAPAAIMQTGRYDKPLPEPEDFSEAYGPQEGQERYEKFAAAVDVSRTAYDMRSLPIEEIQSVVAAARPFESGEGAALAQAKYEALAKAADNTIAARQADPAAYVVQDSRVAAAYDAIGNATGNVDAMRAASSNYASLVLAEQEHLGIPAADRRILPDSVAHSLARGFTEPSGQNAAQTMQTLQQQWGKHWPKVFEQLVKEGEIPGTALVVGAMNRPDQQLAAEKLAEASLIGKEELAKAFKSEEVGDLRDEVRDQMLDFGATLASNPGAERTYNTFSEAINLLALTYMREGDGFSRAATRAYNDVLGKKYTMMGTFRVPVEHDANRVSAASERILTQLQGFNVDVPTSLVGLEPEEARNAYISAVKDKGFWVTSTDEGGLTLYDETQSAVTENGVPITLSWQELLARTDELPRAGRRPVEWLSPQEQQQRVDAGKPARPAAVAEPEPVRPPPGTARSLTPEQQALQERFSETPASPEPTVLGGQ